MQAGVRDMLTSMLVSLLVSAFRLMPEAIFMPWTEVRGKGWGTVRILFRASFGQKECRLDLQISSFMIVDGFKEKCGLLNESSPINCPGF